MIVYQLPSGKIVYLTVEQFLRLTDDDIKQYEDSYLGSSGHNPFKKLPYERTDKFIDEDDDIDEDQYFDYTSDDDDFIEPFDINRLFED